MIRMKYDEVKAIFNDWSLVATKYDNTDEAIETFRELTEKAYDRRIPVSPIKLPSKKGDVVACPVCGRHRRVFKDSNRIEYCQGCGQALYLFRSK